MRFAQMRPTWWRRATRTSSAVKYSRPRQASRQGRLIAGHWSFYNGVLAMIVELETYLQNLLPWELIIRINGVGYAVRPLTLGDLASLEAVVRQRDVEIGKLVALIESLFTSPRPDVRAWPPQYLMPLIMQVLTYFSEFTKKNGAAMAAAAARPAPGTSVAPGS